MCGLGLFFFKIDKYACLGIKIPCYLLDAWLVCVCVSLEYKYWISF